MSDLDKGRSVIDLFVVSVLLDAGAGTKWQYYEKKHNITIGRSEGLCIKFYIRPCELLYVLRKLIFIKII